MATMVKTYLEENYDTSSTAFIVANDNTMINGSSSFDSISINSGVMGTVVDSTVEYITLSGTFSDYTYKKGFGSNIEVYDGVDLVMSLTDVEGKYLDFSDTEENLHYNVDEDIITLGNVEVGTNELIINDTTLSTTATDIEGSTIAGSGDTTVTGSDSDDTFSILTEGSNSITAGLGKDTITLGDGADTIIIGESTSSTDEATFNIIVEVGTNTGVKLTLTNNVDGTTIVVDDDAGTGSGAITFTAGGVGGTSDIVFTPTTDLVAGDAVSIEVDSTGDETVDVTPQASTDVGTFSIAVEEGTNSGVKLTLTNNVDGTTIMVDDNAGTASGAITFTAGGVGGATDIVFTPDADLVAGDGVSIEVVSNGYGYVSVTPNTSTDEATFSIAVESGTNSDLKLTLTNNVDGTTVVIDDTAGTASGAITFTAGGVGGATDIVFTPDADLVVGDAVSIVVDSAGDETVSVTPINTSTDEGTFSIAVESGTNSDLKFTLTNNVDGTTVVVDDTAGTASGAITFTAGGIGGATDIVFTPDADLVVGDGVSIAVDSLGSETVSVTATNASTDEATFTIAVEAGMAFGVILTLTNNVDGTSVTPMETVGSSGGAITFASGGVGGARDIVFTPDANLFRGDTISIVVDSAGNETISVTGANISNASTVTGFDATSAFTTSSTVTGFDADSITKASTATGFNEEGTISTVSTTVTGFDIDYITNASTVTGFDTDSVVVSDSPFSVADIINNFTADTDKLDLLSSVVTSDTTSGTGDATEDATSNAVVIGEMTIATGVVSFKGADDTTEVLIESEDAMTAALTYLSAEIADGETVAFDYDLGGTSGTYVFQGDSGADIAVNLVGISAIDLGSDLDLI